MSEVLDSPLSERFFAEYPPKKLGSVAMRFADEPLDMTFLLVYHGRDAMVPEVTSELIRNSDVVLVEGAGWQPDQQKTLDKISSGDVTAFAAHEIFNSPFDAAILRLLIGKNKPIKYCDRPYSRKFAAEIEAIGKFPPGLHTTSKVDVATNILACKYRDTYRSVLGRDKYILGNVAQTVLSAGTGSDKKALLIIGAGHLTLPYVMRRDIKRNGLEGQHSVTEVSPEANVSYQARLYGEYLSGKPFTEELLLKDMILRRMTEKNPDHVAFIDTLSHDDTRKLFADAVLRR